jgi:hypothetical protein
VNSKIPQTKKALFLNTVFWGFALWFFGYILGFVLFAFVPKDLLGWVIMPFGIAVTLWVLFKKIARKELKCYFGLAIFWTLIAVVFDYLFIIKLLNSSYYYKLDVYLYYLLIFALPIVAGWYKFNKIKVNRGDKQ